MGVLDGTSFFTISLIYAALFVVMIAMLSYGAAYFFGFNFQKVMITLFVLWGIAAGVNYLNNESRLMR